MNTRIYYLKASGNSLSGNPCSASGREMELEFELEMEFSRTWLEETKEDMAIEKTKLLALQLEGLINLCISGQVRIYDFIKILFCCHLDFEFTMLLQFLFLLFLFFLNF